MIPDAKLKVYCRQMLGEDLPILQCLPSSSELDRQGISAETVIDMYFVTEPLRRGDSRLDWLRRVLLAIWKDYPEMRRDYPGMAARA